MSFELEERVRFGYYGDSQLRKTILLTLAAYADDDGTNIFPSNETIAGIVVCTPRAVQTHVKALKEEGILIPGSPSERYAKLPEGQRPNLWRINFEKITKVARKDVRGHLKMLRELRSEEEGRGERGSGGGVNEVHPTKSGYQVSIPISSSLPSIQSEPPALANPTNYPHAEEEKPLQNEVQEGREDEEVTTSFTETQSSTDIPSSSLQAGNLYADQIEADSVGPEELARRRLASLNLPWTPPVAPYLIALNNYPHIDMDMLIVDYIDWSGRNDVKRTVNGWNNFIRTEHERQMRVEGNAAREERQKRNWIRKHFGADY